MSSERGYGSSSGQPRRSAYEEPYDPVYNNRSNQRVDPSYQPALDPNYRTSTSSSSGSPSSSMSSSRQATYGSSKGRSSESKSSRRAEIKNNSHYKDDMKRLKESDTRYLKNSGYGVDDGRGTKSGAGKSSDPRYYGNGYGNGHR